MEESVKKKRLVDPKEEENPNPNSNSHNQLFICADQILPWLNPKELSTVSLTCKALYLLAKSIILSRSLDASRSFETLPIPFVNQFDYEQCPYAHFIYSPTQVLSSPSPPRQPWGSTKLGNDSLSQLVGKSSSFGLSRRWLASRVGELGRIGGQNWSNFGQENELGRERVKIGSDSVSGIGFESVSEVDEERVRCGCDCEGCGPGDRLLEVEELEMGIMRECGASCGCGLECGNRLTQRRIEVKLKIVRDGRKGWCLFADQLIRQGQFVCEYAGELLTTEEARRRQLIYDELSSTGKFSSALLVVREHLPSGKACLRINIDATRIGNVARFINHSCDGGNLSTMLVRNPDSLLPRLCFFASKAIKQGEELTFSYGEIRVRSNGLQCFCGSAACFGTLPAEHT